MELRQLRYFLAVADELHFGRAAQRLRISQPPLSAAIKSLERELGILLFHRSTRRVSLTPEGSHFRDRVAATLADLDAAVAEVGEVREGIRGRLRVGYVSSASYSILPGAVRRFQAAMPRVDLQLSPLTSAEQINGLIAGDLDIALLRDHLSTAEIDEERVLTERLVAVVPDSHPVATSSSVTPEELSGEPLILFPAELMPGYVSRIAAALRASGGRLNVVQRTIHQETVLGLVAAGMGLSILPESVARVTMPGVASVPLHTPATTSLQLAWHAERGQAARVFSECVHRVAAFEGA